MPTETWRSQEKRRVFSLGELFFLLTSPLMGDPVDTPFLILHFYLKYRIVVMSVRRIVQRWEATRAPTQVADPGRPRHNSAVSHFLASGFIWVRRPMR